VNFSHSILNTFFIDECSQSKKYNLLKRQRLNLIVIILHSILNDNQGSKRQLLNL